jgi:hypothetical protein
MYQAIDKLTLIHFIIYFVIGYFIDFIDINFVIIMSITWEIFEEILANNETTRKLLIKYWPIPEIYWNEKNIMNKIIDILVNVFGFYVGRCIRK